VVGRIRAGQGLTTLLVVAVEADRFFHEHHLPLSSRLPFVNVCRRSQPAPSEHNHHHQQQQRDGMRELLTRRNLSAAAG